MFPCRRTTLGCLVAAAVVGCLGSLVGVPPSAENTRGKQPSETGQTGRGTQAPVRSDAKESAARHWRMRPGVFQSFGPDVEPDRDGWLDVTVEGWEVRGVGRRVETRRGSKLTSVTVLTPRWQFTWDVTANVVVAHSACSYQHELAGESMPLSWLREALETHLKATAISYTVEKDRRDGKPVEKITAKYLAVPGWIGEEPTHGFDAKRDHKLAKIPGAKFLTRTYWFDPMTHVIVGYRCGCQKPKQEWWCDYPAPESVPRELFTFRVPREATLEINDPELGRQVRSEGQKGPDLRQ